MSGIRSQSEKQTIGALSSFVSVGVTPFNPDDIPGLKLWLDANDPLNNGTLPPNMSSLPVWVDRSAFGNNADNGVAIQQPTFLTNTLNSLPTVSFNGTTNFLSLPNGVLSNGNNPYTVFAVVNFAAITNPLGTFSGFLNLGNYFVNNQGCAFRTENASFPSSVFHYWWNNDVKTGANTITAGVAVSLTFNYRPSGGVNGRSIYIGGIFSAFNGSTALNLVNNGLASVGKTFNNEFLRGNLAEILVYDSFLETGNRTAVQAYLTAKWGV